MITLTLKNNSEKKFNLKDYETEMNLHNAWFAMHDDKKYKNKRFKIITDMGENLSILISEIKNCEFNESFYIKNSVKSFC